MISFFLCTYYDMSQCLLSQIGLRLCTFACKKTAKKQHPPKKKKLVRLCIFLDIDPLNENIVLPFSLQCQVYDMARERMSILDILILFNFGEKYISGNVIISADLRPFEAKYDWLANKK